MATVSPKERFGANLKRARQKAGLTQVELATLAQVHPSEVSRLERGARDPRLLTTVRLARALHIEATALVQGIR